MNLDDFPLDATSLFSPQRYANNLYGKVCDRILKTTTINLLPLNGLDKIPIKLIHAHFGPQGVTALKMKSRWNVPLCTTFYGYDVSQRPKQPTWMALYQKLFAQGDLFLVEGPFMKKCLAELGCPENKIQIQRIAIPLDKIHFRARAPKSSTEKVNILFCATLTEKKGHLYALKAVERARQKNKNFVLHMFGKGPLQKSIQHFINTHHLNDYVHLHHEYLPYSKYLDMMNTADIVIHPSITASNGDTEGGAPTTILEAQAMGIPVLSTYHADIPNIVVPGQSALLSPEKDAVTLAENLLTLLENPLQWKKMGETGRDFTADWHDINKEIVSLEEKYFKFVKI